MSKSQSSENTAHTLVYTTRRSLSPRTLSQTDSQIKYSICSSMGRMCGAITMGNAIELSIRNTGHLERRPSIQWFFCSHSSPNQEISLDVLSMNVVVMTRSITTKTHQVETERERDLYLPVWNLKYPRVNTRTKNVGVSYDLISTHL